MNTSETKQVQHVVIEKPKTAESAIRWWIDILFAIIYVVQIGYCAYIGSLKTGMGWLALIVILGGLYIVHQILSGTLSTIGKVLDNN